MNAEDAKSLLTKYEPKQLTVITTDPQVLAARFSPCGKFLVAGSFDSRVRRWNITDAEPKELDSLGGHNGWLTAMAFSPDGETLITADSWGQIRAWSYAAEKAEPKWTIADAHTGWIRDLAVNTDGSLVASCGHDRRCVLRDTKTGKTIQQLPGNGEDLFRLRFHPSGNSLLVADMKGQVQLWNLTNGKVERSYDASVLFKVERLQDVGGVRCLTIDPKAQWLAVGGTKVNGGGSVTGTPTLLLFDLQTGELKQTLSQGGTQDVFVTDAVFHQAGFVMFTISGQPGTGLMAFQRLEDKEPFFLSKKMLNCHSVSLHPDGLRLAVVSTNPGSNGNGRRLNKDGEYEGNRSLIHLMKLPEETAS